MTLRWDENLLNEIVARCKETETGARNIDTVLNVQILPKLARFILEKLSAEDDAFEAVRQACECMGECGEKAAGRTMVEGAGIMTFHTYLLDEISLKFYDFSNDTDEV